MKFYIKVSLVTLTLVVATLVMLLIFVWQPAVAAGLWYVRPDSNNSNICLSPGATCATINGALNRPGLEASDDIRIATGVYTSANLEIEDEICQITKYFGNPILSIGSDGDWDDEGVYRPAVLKEGSSYKMWYTGDDGSTRHIGYATSPDGLTWTKYNNNPVLSPGLWWDINSVFAPTVILDNGLYKMWYAGSDSEKIARIGYATSPDGVIWTKYESNPVLDVGGSWENQDVVESSVLKVGNTFHIWYTGYGNMAARIGHATSLDGITWSKDAANPVLDLGSPGAWDWLNTYSPSVIYYNNMFLLWYSGGTLPQAAQTGYAISTDGSVWTRKRMLIPQGAPGAFDVYSADHATVIADGDQFKVWYSGLNGNNDYTIGYGVAKGCEANTANSIYLPFVSRNSLEVCPAYYIDDFNNPNSGWVIDDNSERRYAYTEGQYQIWIKNPSFGWFVTPGAKATDFTAAVSARRMSGTWGGYGFEFGINKDWSQYYEFVVDGSYYGLWRYDGESRSILQDWESSPYINTGTAWNRLKVIRNGDTISVYANNHLLTTVADSNYIGLRGIGLVAYSPNNTSLDARFDNFSLYPASCGVSAAETAFEMGESEIQKIPARKVEATW